MTHSFPTRRSSDLRFVVLHFLHIYTVGNIFATFVTPCEGSNYGGLDHSRYSRSIRSEEHTSELQSLMRISYAVFCLKKKITHSYHDTTQEINQDRNIQITPTKNINSQHTHT